VNDSAEVLALRKQLLLARSTLCRLRIGHELGVMRQSLQRPTRFLTFAARALLIARFGLGVFKVLRRA
jgi:hypothetical protein